MSQTPAEYPAPQSASKPKPKPKPKGKANVCVAEYLSSTKRIRVRCDQMLIHTSRTEGGVRALNPHSVQARYEDLLRAPPPNVMDDLFLVRGLRMLGPCFLSFTRGPLSLYGLLCSPLLSV